jgi:hypothetical protein
MAMGNRTTVTQLGKFSLPVNMPKVAKGPPTSVPIGKWMGVMMPGKTGALMTANVPGSGAETMRKA